MREVEDAWEVEVRVEDIWDDTEGGDIEDIWDDGEVVIIIEDACVDTEFGIRVEDFWDDTIVGGIVEVSDENNALETSDVTEGYLNLVMLYLM